MKINSSNRKKVSLRITLTLGYLCYCIMALGQSSTWNGTAWSNGAPSSSTGSYTFYVTAGTNCTIGDASMAALYIQNSGTKCTINGTVSATSVTLNSAGPPLTSIVLLGTLNVVNLSSAGMLNNGTGIINLSGTGNNIETGPIDVQTFNVNSGTVTFSGYSKFSNLTIAQNANAVINYNNTLAFPQVTNTLTIDGTLTNTFGYLDLVSTFNYVYFQVQNLIINATGSLQNNGLINPINGFHIGGTISPATSINSYKYSFNDPASSNVLEIFSNANLKFSDLSYTDASYIYLGTLNISSNAIFTLDKNLTVVNLNLTSGGSLISSGSPSVTITTISPIDGKLILSGATLTYTPTSLSLIGTNSELGYMNNSNMVVTGSATTSTITNCLLKQLNLNSGVKGIVNNNSACKIGYIDVTDSLRIQSLPHTDSIKVEATGKVKTCGPIRINKKLEIVDGGSLNSGNGNIIMLDQSDISFAHEGQIQGNIQWHRKYGSTGWIYVGSPFSVANSAAITLGGQTIIMDKYIESSSAKRWQAIPINEAIDPGKGYIVGMNAVVNGNDTLVFIGSPQKRNVTVGGLTYTTTNGSWFDYQRGYNLVANPFLLPISVSGFFNSNPAINSIYYWDNLDNLHGKGVYVTRTRGGLYSPALGTVTTKNQPGIGASYITPNQAFFVKVPDENTTSVFFDTLQITTGKNNNFLKSAIPSYIRLNTCNASGNNNDIVFQFNDAATSIVNPLFDYFKLVSDSYPLEIYSFKNSNRFSIQTLKPDTSEVHIPIGIIVQKNEKHRLWISDFDALPSEINVYINDKSTNRFVNLRDSAFSTVLPIGSYDTRFEVVFKKGLLSGNSQVTTNVEEIENAKNVIISSSPGQMNIQFIKEQNNVSVQICDISGRIVTETHLNNFEGTLNLNQGLISHNIYLVKISGNNLLKTSKIYIQ